MKTMTLCFFVRGSQVCLAMKKRRFGAGKWNGVGGKVEEGETVEQVAIREIEEEIGVRVQAEHLEEAGQLTFIYRDRPEWDCQNHIFLCRTWEGELQESEEVAPAWYEKDGLPFENMWIDDPHWLPLVLADKKIEGVFHFDQQGASIANLSVKVRE